MIAPTSDDIRSWSKVDFDALGYASDTPDPLDVVVARSCAYVTSITGRPIDSTTTDAVLVPMLQECIQLRCEQIAFQSDNDFAETANDDVVQSFTAGSYSETHVDPIKRGQARILNSNPRLAALLWQCMTDDQRDLWLAWTTGARVPAQAITGEVDWQERFGPYETLPGIPDVWGSIWP